MTSHNMDWITEKGLDFIDQNKDAPFFLYFATTIPHGPTLSQRSWKVDRRITPLGILDKAPQVHPQFMGDLTQKEKDQIAEDPGLESTIRNIKSITEEFVSKDMPDRKKRICFGWMML